MAPKGHDTAGIYESYGRGWLVQIPDEKESVLKEGEWNTLRLRVQGDRVQTWLNGEAMADITDAKIGAAQGRMPCKSTTAEASKSSGATSGSRPYKSKTT